MGSDVTGDEATTDWEGRLGAFVRRTCGATMTSARLLSGGASRETWVIDVTDASFERLILRRDPPGLIREGGVDLEAAAIGAARVSGVPVPDVIAVDDGTVLGTPSMLTSFVDGETVPRRILAAPSLAAARPRLARECGRILARLHAVAPDAVAGLPVLDGLAFQRQRLDDLNEPHPVLELGLAWLDRNRPSPAPAGVVHGDFRNGNLIVDERGIAAVLDWEVVHHGDPYEDLGWLCTRVWRFGSDEPVGGFGGLSELIAGYEEVTGAAVDRHRFRWWLVFGTTRWGITCGFQAAKHLSGQQPSIDLAAIGRRGCESELDLLDLLDHVEAHP